MATTDRIRSTLAARDDASVEVANKDYLVNPFTGRVQETIKPERTRKPSTTTRLSTWSGRPTSNPSARSW